MSTDRPAHNPLHSTFAPDTSKPDLAAPLSTACPASPSFLRIVPFGELGHNSMNMLDHKAELDEILKYHVVDGRGTAAELARGAH